MFRSYHFILNIIIIIFYIFHSNIVHAVSSFIVDDIKIEGLERIEPETIFSYLPIKIGCVFDELKSSEVIKVLFATGFFNDVHITTENNVVIIHIKEQPVVTSIDFAGIHKFDKNILTKIMNTIGLIVGNSYSKKFIEKAEHELKNQYMIHGYYATVINTTVTPINNNRVMILFSVTENSTAKIKEIHFIGNRIFNSSILYDEMKLSTKNWFSWYTKNNIFSKNTLLNDLKNITYYYRDHGYLNFNIESTEITISPDKHDIYITIYIYEGKPYKISNITLTGELLNKKNEIIKLITIKVGEYFSATKVNKSHKAIIDYLSKYGYTFARVNTQQKINNNHYTVALTMNVKSGKRIYVRNINITGNNRTKDEVVRREMRQFESSWFDSSRLKISQDRINRLGYFTAVSITTTPVKNTLDQIDINVQVTEKPTGTIALGTGFSSSDKIVLTAGISQDNVFGSGTGLAINLNTAHRYRTLEIIQTDPYFTINGIIRSTSAYYKTYYPLYYSNGDKRFSILNIGANLKFGVPFSELDTVYFGIGASQYYINLTKKTPRSYKNYVAQTGSTSNVIPLTLGWSHDTRDSALVPSRGYYSHINAELGTPVGYKYYKFDFQDQYYYSFTRGFILGLNCQLGYGSGYNGKPFPIFKNYFAGGIGFVRGYAPNSLGPRDSQVGHSIGGSKLLIGNLELTFPIHSTGYDRTLRIFTFLDVGNIWGDKQNINLGDLRFGYGLGLAWLSPIGPLKASFGFPLIKYENDKYQKFQFQIGTAF